MLDIILLIANFVLFMLSFIFVVLDVLSLNDTHKKDIEKGKIPKLSRYSLLFSLLTMLSLVLVSIIT